MSYESDDVALRAALEGEELAFRWLVERHQQRIYAIIYGQVRDPAIAKQLAEATFVKAYQNLERCQSGFSVWLQRIAMNLCVDHRRRERHESTHPPNSTDGEVESRAPDLAQHARIVALMGQLPEDQRVAIQLRELEGLTYREIAQRLEIPEGHVMSRLFYARKALQALLEQSE